MMREREICAKAMEKGKRSFRDGCEKEEGRGVKTQKTNSVHSVRFGSDE